MQPQVGIVMGSDSDLPVMQECARILEEMNVPYEITIVSAHRTPKKLYTYGEEAYKRGLKVIVAGAGGAAHLPGMLAAITTVPVIGVPIKSRSLQGIDSMLSILQMPPGVPVATVAINGAKNAGILATQMLAMSDEKYHFKIETFKKEMETVVEEKAEKLLNKGYMEYLKDRQ